ncbi:hypothetical protein [Ammoniphilus resinae]|uniref:Uncharacterized protein n=1 Tax=Ammoniphilus resinae TaxID=861532 RepID=A0ABS4GJN0_9BACL|nr:hypothetical protein [Ammoniphilus resinae]MBP1930456.1 hypothetical protein [Ammoniphilus resinae]
MYVNLTVLSPTEIEKEFRSFPDGMDFVSFNALTNIEAGNRMYPRGIGFELRFKTKAWHGINGTLLV